MTHRPASVLFDGVDPDERFYFVHSYAAHGDTRSTPGSRSPITASRSSPRSSAARSPVTQFHPEKSGDAGARLLRNWVASCASRTAAPDLDRLSKERAIRRAAREAEDARGPAQARARVAARRAKRADELRRAARPGCRTGGSARCSRAGPRAQRTAISLAAVIVLWLIWLLFDDLATRVALTAALLLALPAIIVVAFGRRTSAHDAPGH